MLTAALVAVAATRFELETYEPQASAAAVVTSGHARFIHSFIHRPHTAPPPDARGSPSGRGHGPAHTHALCPLPCASHDANLVCVCPSCARHD
eukprot:3805872-Prymnesium_polylepis.1